MRSACSWPSQLPHAMIIEGDGTDSELIDSENIFQTDAFVCLTDRDEENLLMALTAQRAGVPKVLAKMTRPNYMDLVKETRLGSIISPKDIIANQITRYVRALANSQDSAVESLYKMLGGQIEALEFTAGAGSARCSGGNSGPEAAQGRAARGHCAAGLRHHHPRRHDGDPEGRPRRRGRAGDGAEESDGYPRIMQKKRGPVRPRVR